eukprot:gene41551-18508_t
MRTARSILLLLFPLLPAPAPPDPPAGPTIRPASPPVLRSCEQVTEFI